MILHWYKLILLFSSHICCTYQKNLAMKKNNFLKKAKFIYFFELAYTFKARHRPHHGDSKSIIRIYSTNKAPFITSAQKSARLGAAHCNILFWAAVKLTIDYSRICVNSFVYKFFEALHDKLNSNNNRYY
jgi:hypothetical protein